MDPNWEQPGVLDEELCNVLGLTREQVHLNAHDHTFVPPTTDQQYIAALIRLKDILVSGNPERITGNSSLTLLERIPTIWKVIKIAPRSYGTELETARDMQNMNRYGFVQEELGGKFAAGFRFLAPFTKPGREAIGLVTTRGLLRGSIIANEDQNVGIAIDCQGQKYVISPCVLSQGRNNLLIVLDKR